jgi:hypothetical protein
MKEIGIEELKESIRKVGFIQVDKVVLRPLKPKSFVVLEGNRRIAALKILIQEVAEEGIPIEKEILDTINAFKAFVYTGNDRDIAWTIQGIRHISGVRNWPAYQQALTLAKLTSQGTSIRDASDILGISAPMAARLIRAMIGFQCARKDEEYGDQLKPGHFAYFNEVIFRQQVLQKYLKWDEKKKRFADQANLKKLLSWIFPESDKEAKITQARQLRDDIVPVMINHPELFERWENDEDMTVKTLNIELGKELSKHVEIDAAGWLEKIDFFISEMSELPVLKIKSRKDDFMKKLEEAKTIIQAHLDILSKL